MKTTPPPSPAALAQLLPGKSNPQESRQAEILGLLQVHRRCQITDLARLFDVSEETIRRDIRQLEMEGHAARLRGGVKLSEKIHESPYMVRRNQNGDVKRRIAFKAASLVRDGMTLLIDSGSTCYWLAEALAPFRDLTVVTNSLEISRELVMRSNCEIYFAGGKIDRDYLACFGDETRAFLQRFTPEIAFLSISAIDSRRGLLDLHYPEAMLKGELAGMASQVVLLSDSSKFERQGKAKALDFAQIDMLVTDRIPGPLLAKALDGVEILLAEEEEA